MPPNPQVWRYNEGYITHVGKGHSGEVTGVKISPDGQHIVSVSDDGAVMVWKYPIISLQDSLALDLPSQMETPQNPEDSNRTTLGQRSEAMSLEQGPVEDMEMAKVGGVTPSQDMEVGGASPKQEE